MSEIAERVRNFGREHPTSNGNGNDVSHGIPGGVQNFARPDVNNCSRAEEEDFEIEERKIVPVIASEFVAAFPKMRPPVVEGILRRGETINIIASSKAMKSWLGQGLGLSIGAGIPWLGRFKTTPGRVLLCDNELHPETLSNRLGRVAGAMGINLAELGDALSVMSFRGKLVDIRRLQSLICPFGPGRYDVVILDANYRFWPAGLDENSNGDVTEYYNTIDEIAAMLDAAVVLVHHSTKGGQSEKSVTDVGAGAGAQSRAADCHLVLRPHQEDGVVVAEAAVRSWQPFAPVCLRWNFPLWEIDDTLDPTDLRRGDRKKPAKEEPTWTPETFVATCLTDAPQTQEEIEALAGIEGISGRQAIKFLRLAKSAGLVEVSGGTKGNPARYSRRRAISNEPA